MFSLGRPIMKKALLTAILALGFAFSSGAALAHHG
jgi:hypothetical protein